MNMKIYTGINLLTDEQIKWGNKMNHRTVILMTLLITTAVVSGTGCAGKNDTVIAAKNLSQNDSQQSQPNLTESEIGPHKIQLLGQINLSQSENITSASSDGRLKIIIEPAKILNSASGANEDGYRIWLQKESDINNVEFSYSVQSAEGGNMSSSMSFSGDNGSESSYVAQFGASGIIPVVNVKIIYEDPQR